MAILSVAVLVIIASAILMYLFFKKKFSHWRHLGFKHTNPSFPFGDANGMGFNKTVGVVIDNVYKQFPKERFVGFWLFSQPNLLIRDPELIKEVLVRDFSHFHSRGIYFNEKDDPLSAHLFSINGSKWRNLRLKMTPTFTSGKMKMMFPMVAECGRNLKNILDSPASKEEVIEIKEFVTRFTIDVIAICVFGIESNSIQNVDSEFRYFGQKIFEPKVVNLISWSCQFLAPEVAKFFSLCFTDKDSANFFLKAMKETMDFREKYKVRRKDFMDLLIQLKENGKLDDGDNENNDAKDVPKLTFEEAAAQAFLFFIAGFETSSTTMQFALYELAINPTIQNKTRDEIKAVLARYNNDLTFECLSEMIYLKRVVDETLRIFPPASFLIRECNTNYKIPGTDLVLPAGNKVVIDVLGLHHDPEHFQNPGKFDPDRFTEEEKANRHAYSYIPFGEGPRSCIGMKFGLMKVKLGLAMLLANFEFSAVAETPIPIVLDPKSFVLQPINGIRLKIKKV